MPEFRGSTDPSSCGSTEAAVAVRKQLWQYGSSCGSTEAAVEVRKQLWKYGSSCGSTEAAVAVRIQAAVAVRKQLRLGAGPQNETKPSLLLVTSCAKSG